MSTIMYAPAGPSHDPLTRRLVRERADARTLAAAKTEGKAELLLELLRTKLGPLPESTVTRVRSAQPDQISLWARRVLTSYTLGQILAP